MARASTTVPKLRDDARVALARGTGNKSYNLSTLPYSYDTKNIIIF